MSSTNRMKEAACAGDHTVVCVSNTTDVVPDETPETGDALSDFFAEQDSSVLLDDPRCGGPVAGLLAAIRHAILIGANALVFQPVDMPFLTSQALVDIRSCAMQNDAITFAAGSQPPKLVWTLGAIPASMLVEVEQRIINLTGVNAEVPNTSPGLKTVFDGLNTVVMSLPDDILRNVNTPSDLSPDEEQPR